MEDDMGEKTCMSHESTALQAAEKSFYDVLGEKYPLCSDVDDGSQQTATQSISRSFSNSATGTSYAMEGFVDSTVSTLRLPDLSSDSNSIMQFHRGVEEASKFLPNGGKLFADLESHGFSFIDRKEETKNVEQKIRSRGKRNTHSEDESWESDRSNKQSAICSESIVSSDTFDIVLLNCDALREALQSETNKKVEQNGQSKGSNGKSRGKKKGGKKDVIDLRTLLTLCVQAVASNDRRSANDLLKQIRQHSSPEGDGMQRMAYFFADGLEARLAGSGTQVH